MHTSGTQCTWMTPFPLLTGHIATPSRAASHGTARPSHQAMLSSVAAAPAGHVFAHHPPSGGVLRPSAAPAAAATHRSASPAAAMGSHHGEAPASHGAPAVHPHVGIVLYSEDVIAARVRQLATQLSAEYQDKSPVVLQVRAGRVQGARGGALRPRLHSRQGHVLVRPPHLRSAAARVRAERGLLPPCFQNGRRGRTRLPRRGAAVPVVGWGDTRAERAGLCYKTDTPLRCPPRCCAAPSCSRLTCAGT